MTPPITTFNPEELNAFKSDGYVIVRGLYSKTEMKTVSGWIDELISREPQKGHEMLYYEDSLKEPGKRIVSRIENFSDYHEGFKKLFHEARLIERVESLLGEKTVLFKEKINFKMPGGAGFEPHQDIQPGWDDYASYFISILITVDPSPIEHGCLELSAGHHKRGLLGEKWKPLTPEQLKGVHFTPFPMEPGDVAFFDCFVPHQSKPNLTNNQRRNIYLTFNRSSEGDARKKYFDDKRKSYPPDNERESGKVYKFRV
jgi:ectoine hydroxylase-related dioxygenase (phytanoyl-CoA dioxygenase family)